jgi:hypothetical protein
MRIMWPLTSAIRPSAKLGTMGQARLVELLSASIPRLGQILADPSHVDRSLEIMTARFEIFARPPFAIGRWLMAQRLILKGARHLAGLDEMIAERSMGRAHSGDQKI